MTHSHRTKLIDLISSHLNWTPNWRDGRPVQLSSIWFNSDDMKSDHMRWVMWTCLYKRVSRVMIAVFIVVDQRQDTIRAITMSWGAVEWTGIGPHVA